VNVQLVKKLKLFILTILDTTLEKTESTQQSEEQLRKVDIETLKTCVEKYRKRSEACQKEIQKLREKIDGLKETVRNLLIKNKGLVTKVNNINKDYNTECVAEEKVEASFESRETWPNVDDAKVTLGTQVLDEIAVLKAEQKMFMDRCVVSHIKLYEQSEEIVRLEVFTQRLESRNKYLHKKTKYLNKIYQIPKESPYYYANISLT
jgi:seryl-tRNA synthetase